MKIKTKIALALTFLFGVILGIIALSLYYIKGLSTEAENILKDNYESIVYMNRIAESADSLFVDSARVLASIRSNLILQEQNVTEPGEVELTRMLRMRFENIRAGDLSPNAISNLRKLCFTIQDLNMKAIITKSEITIQSAESANRYLVIIATIVGLVAFTFIVNFPGYVANPIALLTNSIKLIANKNYEERLHFNRSDEFRELADAFNQMAEKMDEYEHSNLAKILFEKKRIETIINRMSDPVIGLDEERKVVFANDQALTLLNLTLSQVVGRYAPDIAVENDLFRNLIRINIRLNGERDEKSNLIKVVINGKENYFSRESITINYKPTGEKENLAIGEVILLKNVTPFKELDLAKTNFIATISHELKTPIASLQMGIKLLRDQRIGNLNSEQANLISTLTDETARLSRITHELLDLAQVETGNIKLNLGKILPHDVILHAQEAVKFHAERKKVTLKIEEDPNLPAMRADIDKTTWVLVNLLTNAIRHSPENEVVLLRCFASGDKVHFSIGDSGPGVDEKYLGRLFEKYFQVPGAPSGTGLGLAISKEFVEAQGGEIVVESEPGKGSTFTFRLRTAESSI